MIARRAAAQIALDMGAEHRSEGAKWHAVESFVGALLQGSHDRKWLQERSGYLDVPLDAPRVVCLIRARYTTGAVPSARAVAEALGFAAGRTEALLTPIGSDLVAVIQLTGGADTTSAAQAASDRLSAAIVEVDPELDVLVAVSTVCDRVDHLPRAYDEAGQVMQCMRGHLGGSGTHVLGADELGAGRLFLAMATAADAHQFVERALGSILEQDDLKSRELLHTLYEFLAQWGNARRAAERLGVHQNTVRYRVGRIEELTGLAVWSNPDAQMTAHVALLVLRLSGGLPEVGIPGRQVPRVGRAGSPAR